MRIGDYLTQLRNYKRDFSTKLLVGRRRDRRLLLMTNRASPYQSFPSAYRDIRLHKSAVTILRDGRHPRTSPSDSPTHRTNKHTITPRNNAATRSYSTLFDKNDAFTRLKGHERRTLPVIISPLNTVYWATGPRKVAVVSIISLITHYKEDKIIN